MSPERVNSVILLKSRPGGMPDLENFELKAEPISSPAMGEVLLKSLYVSVDPYLRGKMSGTKSPMFEVGQPISSKIIAEVIESRHPEFTQGDIVSNYLDWKIYQLHDGNGLSKINAIGINLSAYLGVLGITGLSAYFALTDIGCPKAGETMVVSGAAGAVGSIAGQIGKIMGCRVIGIVGTDAKSDLIKNKFGFDEAINYKTTPDINAALTTACPAGVDIYFDNVGGSISDEVLKHINSYGRVAACGAIANYNDSEPTTSPSLLPLVVYKFLTIRGFLIADYAQRFPEGMVKLSEWLKEGKIKYSETILHGFEKLPEAFIGLFNGLNEGKMLVKNI